MNGDTLEGKLNLLRMKKLKTAARKKKLEMRQEKQEKRRTTENNHKEKDISKDKRADIRVFKRSAIDLSTKEDDQN